MRQQGLFILLLPMSFCSMMRAQTSFTYGGLNYTVLSEATAYDSRNGCNALIEAATNTLLTGCKKIYIKRLKY